MTVYKRNSSEPDFRVKVAYNEITNRLNGLGVRWNGNIDLNSAGFGHAWIKIYRSNKKAEYVYICSHSDNMDPNCCEPIYRFIKVYNYTDDTVDDYIEGDIPYFANVEEEVEDTTITYDELLEKLDESCKTWHDNDYCYVGKSGVLYQFIKDPVNENVLNPYTHYPWKLKSLDTEYTLKADDNYANWPVVETDDRNAYYIREDENEEAEEKYLSVTSALSAICTDEDTMYLANSYADVNYIYVPDVIDETAKIGAISGNIVSYHSDSNAEFNEEGSALVSTDDIHVCPTCLGKNVGLSVNTSGDGYSITTCKSRGKVDINNVHYSTYVKTDISEMFVVARRYGASTYKLERSVVDSLASNQTSGSKLYKHEYPIWFELLDDTKHIYKLHYHLYRDAKNMWKVYGKSTSNDDELKLLIKSNVTTVKLTGAKQTFTDKFVIDNSVVEISMVLPSFNNVIRVEDLPKDKYVAPAEDKFTDARDYSYTTAFRFGKLIPYGIYKHANLPNEMESEKKITYNYVKIQPQLCYRYTGKWRVGTDTTSQVVNYTTHNKSKTFDWPWNYDEVMNFIMYKDENLPIYQNDKGIVYSSGKFLQQDNIYYSNVNYKSLKNAAIWFADIDNDDMNITHLVPNYSLSASYVYQDNYKDYYNNVNVYNYNPGYVAWKNINRGGLDKTTMRSLPTYEGIYQYKQDEYKSLPDSYVWMKTAITLDKSGTTEKMAPYYTGEPDTVELHGDFRHDYFMFKTDKPAQSIYYKEEFSAADATNQHPEYGWECGWAGYYALKIPAPPPGQEATQVFSWNQNPTNMYAADYGCDCNQPYRLPGLKKNELRYRHLCPSCRGLGVIGVTLDTPSAPDLQQDRTHRYTMSNDGETIADFKKYPYRCPTCRGCGTRMRYLYYDHDLVTLGLTPVSMTDETKEREILCNVKKQKPISYWYNKTGINNYGCWEEVEYGHEYIYESVNFSAFDTVKSTAGETMKKPHIDGKIDTLKLYSFYEDIDDCVEYYGYDYAFGWKPIYFDKLWIKGQWNKYKDWTHLNAVEVEETPNSSEDHLHHSHENSVYFNAVSPSPVSNEDWDYHNYNYRKSENLNTTCPQCNGTKVVTVYETKADGSPSLDVMGEQRTHEEKCNLCNGNGYITRNFYEGYNIVKCVYCNQTGKITCPICGGTKKVGDKDCTNCSLNGVPQGTIPCPHCGGQLKVSNTFCIVGPDRDSGKKIYKYNLQKSITSDNILFEVSRKFDDIISNYIDGENTEVPYVTPDTPVTPPDTPVWDDSFGITTEDGIDITTEDEIVIVTEDDYSVIDTAAITTEDAYEITTEDGYNIDIDG